jgi:hypothetical protein
MYIIFLLLNLINKKMAENGIDWDSLALSQKDFDKASGLQKKTVFVGVNHDPEKPNIYEESEVIGVVADKPKNAEGEDHCPLKDLTEFEQTARFLNKRNVRGR